MDCPIQIDKVLAPSAVTTLITKNNRCKETMANKVFMPATENISTCSSAPNDNHEPHGISNKTKENTCRPLTSTNSMRGVRKDNIPSLLQRQMFANSQEDSVFNLPSNRTIPENGNSSKYRRTNNFEINSVIYGNITFYIHKRRFTLVVYIFR